MPPGAQRTYGTAQEGDEMGFYLNRHTGAVESIPFRVIARAKGSRGDDTDAQPSKPGARADVTQKGVTMIGDYRTDALHKALEVSDIDDQTLIGLLVLALAGKNVAVQSPVHSSNYYSRANDRAVTAAKIIEGGVLSTDPETTRATARAVLRQVLSCRDGMTDSGMVARIAGDAIGANAFLPNMGTDDFLKCLSKAAMERAATALNVLPRQTGKATRAAMIEHVGEATYILPAARFALNPTELERLTADTAERPPSDSDSHDGDGEPSDDDELDGDGADGEGDESGCMPPPHDAGVENLAA